MSTNLKFMLFLMLLMSGHSFAGPNLRAEEHISTLRGVNTVGLWVVGIDSHAMAIGLSENALRNSVLPSLEQLGIKVLSKEAAEADTTIPRLSVYVNVNRNNVDTSYSVELEVWQAVRTLITASSIHVPTWSFGSVGMARNGVVSSEVLAYVRNAAQIFRKDYQLANTK
jgi:hypothetical protein